MQENLGKILDMDEFVTRYYVENKPLLNKFFHDCGKPAQTSTLGICPVERVDCLSVCVDDTGRLDRSMCGGMI